MRCISSSVILEPEGRHRPWLNSFSEVPLPKNGVYQKQVVVAWVSRVGGIRYFLDQGLDEAVQLAQ